MKTPSPNRSWYVSETAVVYGSTPVWPEKTRAKRDAAALVVAIAMRGWRMP